MATTISTVDFCLTSFKKYKPQYKPAEGYFYDSAPPLMGTLYTVEGVNDANNQPRKLSMAELVMVVCLARAADKEKAVINLMKEMSDTTEILKGLTDIETKLLDGGKINSIVGTYNYNGVTFTKATAFLAALGVVPGGDKLQSEAQICKELDSGTPFFKIQGSFSINGTSYSAYNFIMRILPIVNSELRSAYSDMSALNSWGDAPLTNVQLQQLNLHYGFSLPYGTTASQALTAMEEKYDPQLSEWLKQDMTSSSVYVSTSTDQLITDIESKMDSLNSFSQEKMIELQSETNKRDQAYDMITNILKSMNTVQVGIVNNM